MKICIRRDFTKTRQCPRSDLALSIVPALFAAFLELLPAMRVRQYSISSSPLWHADQCTLTVAVVDAPAWSGTGQYKGVCSTYLARLAVGDPIAVAVRKPNAPFHPPADLQKPVVMIAAGTGIAPSVALSKSALDGFSKHTQLLLLLFCSLVVTPRRRFFVSR